MQAFCEICVSAAPRLRSGVLGVDAGRDELALDLGEL
jgi:hypothetical protein